MRHDPRAVKMHSQKTVYITTPIYYVNGRPHIGGATTTLCADVLTRYHRMRGRKAWFLTGTDEQATKVVEAAEKAGVPTMEFVDRLANEFKETWRALHIEFDDFIRTTEPRHIRVVQEIFRRLQASGDMYKDLYEGWYCVADETFFRDSDVGPDCLCPNPECRGPLRRVQEENYFFRLSAYGDRLLAHIEANPGFLQPDFRRNEVIGFIQQGLRDISVTRPNTGWGIPVADEPGQVIYVWFDAVINYLSATGWPDDRERYEELWPAIHLMAKEIFVRFHATLWPAMLLALGVPLPETVYAHGFWVDAEGKKQGKRTGGLPHPIEFAEQLAAVTGLDREIAIDSVRYLLMREMVFPGDTEYSREAFYSRYNSDLANDLGNLCNRAVTMVSRYFGGVIPAPARQDAEIAALAADVAAAYAEELGSFRFHGALEAVWRLVGRMNRYIEEKAPWKLAKAGDAEELGVVLYSCLESVRVAATLAMPYMPVACEAILRQIGCDRTASTASWADVERWGLLEGGARLPAPAPIFPRIQAPGKPAAAPAQPAKESKMTDTKSTPEPSAASETPSGPPQITIDEFMKVDLRTARVLAAEAVPNATKLLKLTVDLGAEQRTILAGIAEMYTPEEVVGRTIVVVANLQPRKMRGIESQGMLLAADVDGQAILVQPETQTPPGARVR